MKRYTKTHTTYICIGQVLFPPKDYPSAIMSEKTATPFSQNYPLSLYQNLPGKTSHDIKGDNSPLLLLPAAPLLQLLILAHWPSYLLRWPGTHSVVCLEKSSQGISTYSQH